MARDSVGAESASPAGMAGAAGDITLAGLLNVLWRRRGIVVLLPLLGLVAGVVYSLVAPRMYEARANIRPGITAFTPEGGPVREWMLKDITRWYDDMLYREQLVEYLGLARDARPVIRAEFIAQGLQNLQGGDVVTLTTYARTQELARSILATSIELFVAYAEADSLSSGIKLTRDGLRIRLDRLREEEGDLEREAETIELRMATALSESLQIENDLARLELAIQDQRAQSEGYRGNLGALAHEQTTLSSALGELDVAIASLKAGAGETTDLSQVPDWIDRDVVLTGPEVLGSLVRTRADLQEKLRANAVVQDTLRTAVKRADIAIERLVLQRDRDSVVMRLTAHQKLGELRLQRRFGLRLLAADLSVQSREARVQLNTLSPLERVGRIIVSDKPARPRKLRAIVILLLLGTAGGLALAFAWDFVQHHRTEILRS